MRFDRFLKIFCTLAAISTGVLVALIFAFLVYEARDVLGSIPLERFWSDQSWHPEAKVDQGLFFILPMLVGTLSVTAIAVAIALPLGVLLAVFCEFYAPAFCRQLVTRVVELLAGVPSVVFGLWGLVVLVPVIQAIKAPGVSLLAGGIILSLMILPVIAISSKSAISAAKQASQTSAAALGLSRGSIVWEVILPLARSGIVVGTVLAIARAIGETMVVMMVCGNLPVIPQSVFDPVRTLTATIALEMGYSFGAHRGALFMIGLLLMFSVLIILSGISVIKQMRCNA